MVYNNGYPATYQPMAVAQQPMYQQTYQPMQSNLPAKSNTNVVWIQGGLQSAKAYPIEPNSNLIMIDMAEMMAYSKFADGNGMQTPIDMYSITKVIDDGSYSSQANPMITTDNLATKDDVQMIRDELTSNLQQTYNQLESMKQMLEHKNNGNNRKGDNNAEQRNG